MEDGRAGGLRDGLQECCSIACLLPCLSAGSFASLTPLSSVHLSERSSLGRVAGRICNGGDAAAAAGCCYSWQRRPGPMTITWGLRMGDRAGWLAG